MTQAQKLGVTELTIKNSIKLRVPGDAHPSHLNRLRRQFIHYTKLQNLFPEIDKIQELFVQYLNSNLK